MGIRLARPKIEGMVITGARWRFRSGMGIARRSGPGSPRWPSGWRRRAPPRWPSWRWLAWCAGSRSVEAGEGVADAEDEFAVDELLLASGGVAESGACQAVDLAQGALGQLVEGGEGVVG